jgi:hypothetical protein
VVATTLHFLFHFFVGTGGPIGGRGHRPKTTNHNSSLLAHRREKVKLNWQATVLFVSSSPCSLASFVVAASSFRTINSDGVR